MISILIVHYNRPDLLEVCLGSLGDAEDVIVVDNGSLQEMDAQRLKTSFPGVTWSFLDNNVGFSAGVNHAARLAQGDNFFLLNPDTRWGGTCFKDLEAFFTQHEADIVGLKQFTSSGDTQLSVGWEPKVLQEGFRKALQDGLNRNAYTARQLLSLCQKEGGAAWVAGSALLTSRALFESLKGFDERYFLYFEDIDYCLRARQLGATVAYSKAFSLIHHGGACAETTRGVAEQHYRDSQILFFSEHGSLFARHILPWWAQIRKWIKA